MIKQRREAAETYASAGRNELSDKEIAEIAVIEEFLPEQLSPEETELAVATIIEEIGASSLKDMGRTIGVLKERYAGRMDFAKASGMVKSKLSG